MDNARDYKARVEYAVNDATQTVYSFSFPYLRKKFVMAYVIHEDDTITNLQYGVDYTINKFELTLTVPLKENEHLVIYRQTTTKNIIQWNDGSILLSKDMNVSDIQQLHLQEEHDDFARANNMFVSSKNFELTWDALGHRITNVKDPKDPSDVVTKHYMESVQNGFVQQNTALANTATEAAGKAKDSSELAKKWAMSPVSPDGVVDPNSPTGYTQSAKIWATLSKEYAGMSKFKLPIGYYNSVAEMKASETAIAGRPCVTLGYDEPNDGGGAVYIIRQKKESDTDDGGICIFLDNGTVAEMLIEDAVNVKQFGAKGDGVTDDTSAIQNAINYSISHGKKGIDGSYCLPVVIPKGEYRTTATINITKDLSNWELRAEASVINYEGDDYAFYINRLRFSSLHFGTIDARKAGGCIHFKSKYDGTNDFDWFHYVNIYFNSLFAKTDCILSETENKGWGNEVRLFGGCFRAGKYGLRIENNGQTIIDKWGCYNIGIEGVSCGIGLHNNGIGALWEMLFVNCRTEEAKTVLETVGDCHWCLWIDPYPINYSKFKLSSTTTTFKFITGTGYIDIPRDSSIDANSLRNAGSYRISDWNTAHNLKNFPEKSLGVLTVILPTSSLSFYVTQKYEINTGTGKNSPIVYQRTWRQETQTWDNWVRVDGWAMRFGNKVVEVDNNELINKQVMSFIAVDNGVVQVRCSGKIVALRDNTIGIGRENDPKTSDFTQYMDSIPVRKGHEVYIKTIGVTEATIKFVYNG